MKIQNEKVTDNRDSWSRALIFSLPTAGLILALFGYWFTVADRFLIFLYYHDMGPRVPDTAPFSRVTSSRYWMAGLVASGAVMVLYVSANWLLGRLSKRFHAPLWRRVWLLTALHLLIGIPLITMRANEPVLPWSLAIGVTLITLLGLGMSFLPGESAARNPKTLFWLALDGWGLALILLALPQIEDFKLWLRAGSRWFLMITLLLILFGVAWLLLLSLVRALLGIPGDGCKELLLAGFCVTYLLLPFLHHILGTDGFFYLTSSDNFFADRYGTQLLVWMLAALVAWGINRLRLTINNRAADRRDHGDGFSNY